MVLIDSENKVVIAHLFHSIGDIEPLDGNDLFRPPKY